MTSYLQIGAVVVTIVSLIAAKRVRRLAFASIPTEVALEIIARYGTYRKMIPVFLLVFVGTFAMLPFAGLDEVTQHVIVTVVLAAFLLFGIVLNVVMLRSMQAPPRFARLFLLSRLLSFVGMAAAAVLIFLSMQ